MTLRVANERDTHTRAADEEETRSLTVLLLYERRSARRTAPTPVRYRSRRSDSSIASSLIEA
jgi:hypothetical protein